ncbi:reverse transcriptase-9 [Lasius niger]|uniref:Reverse transcriptase-9 n=1 Tax=Lasius niger TaxID=67767 RepID=A0A0J7KH53_LASNI|nr:reverse transcriptase-9 [Lasius niger]
MIKLPGYSLYRCDRVGRSGGGVAFDLSDHLRASIFCSSSESVTVKPEFIVAEILFNDLSKLLLAVVYRPPNSGFLNEFFQSYSELQVNYRHLILGDFNADMNQTTFESQQLSSFISASSLYLVPFTSTHHLRNSSTLLDLCIIDDADISSRNMVNGAAFLSAHDLIYIRYGIKLQRRRGKLVVCRDWRDLDAASFQSDIGDIY